MADPIAAGRVPRGSNPKRIVGEYVVALGQANDNLDATRECQKNQRERLAR